MTSLGSMVKPPTKPLDLGHLILTIGIDLGRHNLAASAATVDLGGPAAVMASLVAWIHQDEDAHDTCSLTACLNPLHPGPCKGWKGTLHSVSPGAWHAIEAARVEKANHNRIQKIEALKAQGKPIPHKLLQPILPKPHPNAGQTANKATGEAHAAGQAVTESAGVKTGAPGKVSLGQATKTVGPVEKGPKGKKPTLGSKGIAFVIAQEKVTPQYKLDKAAAITPEQWAGLSEADQSTIRGELTKIKKDGFGPQQKKADELLAKLASGAQPKGSTLKSGDPNTITTPSGKVYQKVELKPEAPKKFIGQKDSHGVVSKAKPGGETTVATSVGVPNGYQITKDGMGWSLKHKGKLIRTSSTKEALVEYAQEHHAKSTAVASPPEPQDAHETGSKLGGPQLGDSLYPLSAQKLIKKHGSVTLTYGKGSNQEAVYHDVGVSGDHEHLLTTEGNGDWNITKKDGTKLQNLGKKSVVEVTANPLPSVADFEKAGPPKITEAKEVSPSDAANQKTADKLTPTNVAKLIQKNGSVDLEIGGKRVTVGFEGSGHSGKLIMVPGGHYVVTMPDGSKHPLAKGELVQTLPSKPHAPAAPEVKAAPVKALPKHVTDAIAMAKGQAPGATWSKNHLAAYQTLSTDEYKALPPDVRASIILELTKGQSKFLDPKKVAAAKALVEKFTAKPTKIENGAPDTPVDVTLSTHLHDHSITHAQAVQAVKQASVADLFKVAKQTADVSNLENPDATGYLFSIADEDAKALVKQHTKHADAYITGQPGVKAAMEKVETAAQLQSYAQAVQDAKSKAYAKIHKKLATDQGALSPMQEVALEQYAKHLINHTTPPSSAADVDKLKAATKAAENELATALHDAVKKANAPDVSDMSDAQIADRAAELLGEHAFPKFSPSLAEMKTVKGLGEVQAAEAVKQYPPGVITDPAVAARIGAYSNALSQILATKQMIFKLQEHIKDHHQATILSGKDQHGNALTAADKMILAKHAVLLGQEHSHLGKLLEYQEAKLPERKAQLLAAAEKAQAALKEPATVSEHDQGLISEAYSQAWAKAASKATMYGLKSYTDTAKMKAHNEYPAYSQNRGLLKSLAGLIAVTHAAARAAELNVPTHPDTGAPDLTSPEWKTWQNKVDVVDQYEKQFNSLLKKTQTQLDTIRTAAGLKKRSLPKLDNAAVKAAAAETGYFKTGQYGGIHYGKSASAKNYMLAKVGPKLAVVHKTPSDKHMEKLGQPPKPATPSAPMPPPKTHVKPPPSLAGNPTPETAASQGYHYVKGVGTGTQHDWVGAGSPAYVSSPEELRKLQEHLAAEETKFGIAAQKEFKWSINNMESKGAAHAGQAALYSYTGSGYTNVNSKLNNLPPGAKSPGGNISSIDSAFAASPPLEGDVVLYRGFSDPAGVFKSGKWNDVNVAGMEWSQRSYSSTSGSLSTAQSFAGYSGVVMRVIIPKEMKVHGINAKGGQHAGENEIILQRGIRYRVVADYGKHSGKRYIDVMVVPNPYDKSE